MGGGVGRRIEDSSVGNKRFMLLSWNDCKPRLWAILARMTFWNERPLVSKSTYERKKMVEVAMRLGQENLHKTLASSSR